MPKTLLLPAMIVVAVVSLGQTYSGPKCLGPYCIDHKTSLARVGKELGLPLSMASRPGPYCFRSRDGQTFLYVEPIESDPHTVADIFLSDFENCSHFRVQDTTSDLRSWQTPEGIKIGSPEGDVLKAYGKPPFTETINAKTARLVIRGYRAGDKVPSMGERRLFYNGDSDDLSAAEFGIRDGKVSYIWLSYNE